MSTATAVASAIIVTLAVAGVIYLVYTRKKDNVVEQRILRDPVDNEILMREVISCSTLSEWKKIPLTITEYDRILQLTEEGFY